MRAVIPESLDVERPALLGSRCSRCEAVRFPRSETCGNPACAGAAMEPFRIEGEGRLYSWTIQRYQPPAMFAMAPWSPYAIGLVDMDSGVRVLGMVDIDPHDLAIGMPLRLTARIIDGEGRATHAFVPAERASA